MSCCGRIYTDPVAFNHLCILDSGHEDNHKSVDGVMWGNPKFDVVDHPRHYNSHPSGVECIDIAEWHNFNVGNALKYLWRAGLKDEGAPLVDLRKARWYIDREIERVTKTHD